MECNTTMQQLYLKSHRTESLVDRQINIKAFSNRTSKMVRGKKQHQFSIIRHSEKMTPHTTHPASDHPHHPTPTPKGDNKNEEQIAPLFKLIQVQTDTSYSHTHTHTHTYIYIYIYGCLLTANKVVLLLFSTY